MKRQEVKDYICQQNTVKKVVLLLNHRSEIIVIGVCQLLKNCADTDQHRASIAGVVVGFEKENESGSNQQKQTSDKSSRIRGMGLITRLLKQEVVFGIPQSPQVISAVCGLLWTICAEHVARMLAIKDGVFSKVYRLMQIYSSVAIQPSSQEDTYKNVSLDIIEKISGALLMLLNETNTKMSVVNSGIIQLMIAILGKEQYIQETRKPKLFRLICSCLYKLSNDIFALALMKTQEADKILNSTLNFLIKTGDATVKEMAIVMNAKLGNI
ncbi:MAG: hypothetical protein EZS28_016759 [Streblomastix strix]|uniref:Uncharacterized protein n=1 Tax=Streblomastix strix TaxID=222440 RepID=A0A5J4VZM6_9EUKA|nr:MAG: hypothetical protein EZS28_016759 [Streblomastix strix]